MDSDQEVVREPFDDDRGNDSEHSYEHESSPAQETHLDSHTKHYAVQEDDQSDDMELDNEQCTNNEDKDEADSVSSGSFVEDANFAQSFGIELKSKTKRNQTAYDKLVNSNQFFDSTKIAKQGVNGNTESMIKTSVTSDCIYHKGTFYQKGDIVALYDQDDGQVYFAQLTGFLQDQYCEKSAAINWLVPTRKTSRKFFDPSAYRLGLEDVQLRKLDCMTFIRHCPHDYYLRKFFQLTNEEQKNQGNKLNQQVTNLNQPLACSSTGYKRNKEKAYIWTTMKPCPVPQIVPNNLEMNVQNSLH